MEKLPVPNRNRRGFTAIELTAVASIIAILALILVPIVRSRLESVRVTAAQDDMRTIEVAQVLANADTGQYFRLSDLDNPKIDFDTYNSLPPGDPVRAQLARTIPNGTWNRPLNPAEAADANQLGTMGAQWNGPYTTYNRGKFVKLIDLAPQQISRVFDFDSLSGSKPPADSGPIPIIVSTASAGSDPYNDDQANNEDHPIDPWGSPYIFFGPGRMGINYGATALSGLSIPESNFGTGAIYSTGPDGQPGFIPAITATAIDYFREANNLGQGDDLVRIF